MYLSAMGSSDSTGDRRRRWVPRYIRKNWSPMLNWTWPDSGFGAWARINRLVVVRPNILQNPCLSDGKNISFLKMIHGKSLIRTWFHYHDR